MGERGRFPRSACLYAIRDIPENTISPLLRKEGATKSVGRRTKGRTRRRRGRGTTRGSGEQLRRLPWEHHRDCFPMRSILLCSTSKAPEEERLLEKEKRKNTASWHAHLLDHGWIALPTCGWCGALRQLVATVLLLQLGVRAPPRLCGPPSGPSGE